MLGNISKVSDKFKDAIWIYLNFSIDQNEWLHSQVLWTNAILTIFFFKLRFNLIFFSSVFI